MAKNINQAIQNSAKWEILVSTVRTLAKYSPNSPALLQLRTVITEMDRTPAYKWDMAEISHDLIVALYISLPLADIVPAMERELNG